jgi:hypothetical protein
MSEQNTERPGQAWMDKMAAEEPQAREAMQGITEFEPHDGQTSDLNLHYADLLAGPNENHPDPMEGYVAPDTDGDQS